MKTLYVSDLDGTLLREDQRTSAYTNRCINELTDAGLIFTYATARAWQTSHQVTEGLLIRRPVILQNGSFIRDAAMADAADPRGGEPGRPGKILLANFLEGGREIVEDLVSHDIFPSVYAHENGADRFFYQPEVWSDGVRQFVRERERDPRRSPVISYDEIDYSTVFYISCIDEEKKLRPFYEKYIEGFHCEFQRNIYSGHQWLEIMPLKATKANGVLWLKEYLKCDRLVVFGDDTNDMDMFRVADEGYAVENAVAALKEVATGVIGSNGTDSVARWLERNANQA